MVPPTVGQNADFLEEIKVQQVLLTFQAEIPLLYKALNRKRFKEKMTLGRTSSSQQMFSKSFPT